eukprot:8404586-Lingulodinium_polyedra.AAC.1
MARAKHTNRGYLRDVTRELFTEYSDYLLGRRVSELRSQNEDGPTAVRPSWNLILSYEFEVRKLACEKVRDGGVALGQALRDAWKDSETRDLYLVTPYLLQTSRNPEREREKRPLPPNLDVDWWGKRNRGKKGDKGKGKGKADKSNL